MKSIFPVLLPCILLTAIPIEAESAFYTKPNLFTLRPSETDVLSTVDRFGPVGIGIELHQPAFVMKIKNVEPGSPADATGELHAGQIIDSINGETLADIDPRIQLGNMITKAEAKDGIMRFMIREDEDSAPQEVIVQIPVMGNFSETWPLDCEKSENIVRGLASWMQERGWSGGINLDGPRMLFLLSTGDENDLDIVRDWVAKTVEHYENREVSRNVNWHLGYGSVPLAEYYLRTGDESVLPVIRKAVAAAEENYMPGGWAQRGLGNLNYVAGGRMSPAGVHVATFLLLARECGVEVDENVFQGGLQQFFRYAGRGLLAYGDHRPESGYTDNGRSGALAFTMAAAAAQFPEGEENVYSGARDVTAVRSFYTTHRMLHGHSGGGLGEIWRGAAMGLVHETEPLKFREFMDARTWFYELARRFDGSFGIPGGERYDDTNWGAGLGLAFTIPRGHLRIAGAPPTAFSHEVALPERAWGTEADDDFYSLEPATDAEGNAPDVVNERFIDVSASRIYRLAPEAAEAGEDALRLLLYHPEVEIRRMAVGQLNRFPSLTAELLQSQDARVRRAAVDAVTQHRSVLLSEDNIAFLLRMINDPEESWFVVEGALQALNHTDVEVTLPHLDQLIYWMEHPEWWISNVAMLILTRTAAQGHAVEQITQAMRPVMAANQRYSRWSIWTMGPIIENAVPEAQPALLDLFANVYRSWPTHSPAHPEPQHPENERLYTDSLATLMANLPGGLDTLYTLSRERFPQRTLAHRDIFLTSDQIDTNPNMQAALDTIVRDELIPLFVAERAQQLWRAYDNPNRDTERTLGELVGLYNRIDQNGYNWHDYGPERTEMKWEYHSFDPVEQPPLGRERARLGRYRDISYPDGMENWNQPDFDAASAGWGRGLAPFASLNGELRPVGGCRRHKDEGFAFCGCGEEPNTLWENEVLLKRGTFEIPPFENGYMYRILVGGSSHVGFGDGTHIYVNGARIFRSERAVDRREGARPIGTPIAREWWPQFESGQTFLAAKSFLKYYPGTDRYGNYITVFLRRMQIPPLWDELVKGLQLLEMRDANWQEWQDPDSNIDSADNRYVWNGQFTENHAVRGRWKVIDEVQSIRDFDPDSRQHPQRGWRPHIKEITLSNDLHTGDPLLVWTGTKLLDVQRAEALSVAHEQVNDKQYLFIERGGFSPDHQTGWTSPWLVFEKQ